MIQDKTVFIIGAGASKPYGFPTGRKLRKDIINNSPKYIKGFTNHYHISRKELNYFISLFKQSGIYSIDRFLSLQPEFSKIGKLSIALEILKSEALSKFTDDVESSHDWYSYIYNKMIERIPPEADSNWNYFSKNNVSFLTFNYDRSLDYFIQNAFANSFSELRSFQGDDRSLIPFPFYHVYGSAKLPWRQEKLKDQILDYQIGTPDKPFRFNEDTITNIGYENIQLLADGIRIVDGRTDKSIGLEIDKIFLDAKNVFFLGFGYADENLDILGIETNLKGKRVYGTAMGLTDNEMKNVIRRLNTDKNASISAIRANNSKGLKMGSISLLDTDCLTLLREFL